MNKNKMPFKHIAKECTFRYIFSIPETVLELKDIKQFVKNNSKRFYIGKETGNHYDEKPNHEDSREVNYIKKGTWVFKTHEKFTKTMSRFIYKNKPKMLHSSIKETSSIKNATFHRKSQCFIMVDLKKFFDNITADKVKDYFKYSLDYSDEYAQYAADIFTIEGSNGVTALTTGTSPSPILSFLIYEKMFNDLHKLACKYSAIMSIYIDDITFSSEKIIPKSFINEIEKIIEKYGHNISSDKTKYIKGCNATITGTKVVGGRLLMSEKTRKKIKDLLCTLSIEDVNVVRYVANIKSLLGYKSLFIAYEDFKFAEELPNWFDDITKVAKRLFNNEINSHKTSLSVIKYNDNFIKRQKILTRCINSRKGQINKYYNF